MRRRSCIWKALSEMARLPAEFADGGSNFCWLSGAIWVTITIIVDDKNKAKNLERLTERLDMQTILIPLLIICVAGVVGSELMLVYAMVKKNAPITTRTAGKYIMMFLAALMVVVMLLMGIGQREAAQGSAASPAASVASAVSQEQR